MTPQEEAALRQIAMLRASGVPDEEIFGGIAMLRDAGLTDEEIFTIGGGYGYLPYVLDAAGITSSYNLGRGGLAADMLDREYRLTNNPYNVVAANQFYADQGGSPYLTDTTLANVPRGPGSRYSGFIDSLLFPDGAPPNDVSMQPVGAGPTGAQARSAQSVGRTLPGMTGTQFGNTLAGGNIPGFSSINSGDMARLTPDQRAQYFGMVQSTGRVSDAAAAYADFARKYQHGGAYAGGTYR
jgi:hypothetical protein